MMIPSKMNPIDVLPTDFQYTWRARLHKGEPTANDEDFVGGEFRLVDIRRTAPSSFEELRIIVLVTEENGFPLANVPVGFHYSTADFYPILESWRWSPTLPTRAFIAPTQGSGQIDQIQGDRVKEGEPGGISVCLLEPDYSSDIVTGLGALADHTGVRLTFKLYRNGVKPITDRLDVIEKALGIE